MERALFDRVLAVALAALPLAACSTGMAATDSAARVEDARHSSDIVRFSAECEDWDEWDKPAEPFQIYGNTYYVGTCGIAAILINDGDDLILIDSGTEGGADVVMANIRTLGLDPREISGLLTSHEHFDHVGGMAKVEAATGGQIITSDLAAHILAYGEDTVQSYAGYGIDIPVDPQAGMHDPMERVKSAIVYTHRRAVALLDRFGITAHETPGHTPGALTWQWESCEGDVCKTIVYADSLSPVSSDDYKFSEHPQYVADYRAGIARLRELDCDILLTPHPSHSDMIALAAPGTFEGGMTCAEYADSKTEALDERLAREAAAQ